MSNDKAAQLIPTHSHLFGLTRRDTTLSLNVLPSEIIAHIFSFACNVRASACPAKIDSDNADRESHPFPKEPVVLSHTCSYWQQITVNQASLWSHIDVYPARFHDPILLERSETYAARSAEHLLDVHVVIPMLDAYNDDIDTYPFGFAFLASVAHRIRSLNVQSASGSPSQNFCCLVVSNCLAKAVSGKLTEVSIETVIVARWNLLSFPVLATRTDTTGPIFDKTLLTVTTLRLEYAWIGWTCKIYHGLTELRLFGGPLFQQSRLVSTLRSSPQLRVLELGGLARFVAERSPIGSVRLDSLETLILGRIRDNHLKSILRLIEPGTRPLSLSILNPYQGSSNLISKDELQRFITRSNIVRLCANQFQSYSRLAEVLSIVPTVRVLAVDHFSCGLVNEDAVQSHMLTLNSLYVLNSTQPYSFTWPSIEAFVKRHHVRQLTLWKYDFKRSWFDETGYLPVNLKSICPVVKLVPDTEPNPAEGWC
ncbi:hypothetical protein B0J17DRAFT_682422 [Rhizoctonia solani]|nr:hypothetical protein B0J17DRAFT_682422 [Rhizoctonia solani]